VIDATAYQPHFIDHLAPIWARLPERERFTVPTPQLAAYAEKRGVEVSIGKPAGGPLIVAGAGDFLRRPVPTVLVEHGAGQTWPGRHPSYPGGRRREHIGLYICPSERVAQANRAWYPDADYAVVGCPKMDRWLGREWERHDPPVVAVSFHWRRSAFMRYFGMLKKLDKPGKLDAPPFRIIAHAHPRIIDRFAKQYQRIGLEVVRDFDEVLERADLYACDNSSTIFEFALTGRPVVLLDTPAYRRNGSLRFGDAWDVGLHVATPDRLVPVIEQALDDPPEVRAERERIVADVYAVRDGTSSQRAADAISEWLAHDMRAVA
jgi:hypothetical protein